MTTGTLVSDAQFKNMNGTVAVAVIIPALRLFFCDKCSDQSRTKTSMTISTYTAVTARSFHSNLVNALLMDGSVRSFYNDIDLSIWRALSTRDGREVVSELP
jgi:prepilin-type processing-associated H-X9-DG protein